MSKYSKDRWVQRLKKARTADQVDEIVEEIAQGHDIPDRRYVLVAQRGKAFSTSVVRKLSVQQNLGRERQILRESLLANPNLNPQQTTLHLKLLRQQCNQLDVGTQENNEELSPQRMGQADEQAESLYQSIMVAVRADNFHPTQQQIDTLYPAPQIQQQALGYSLDIQPYLRRLSGLLDFCRDCLQKHPPEKLSSAIIQHRLQQYQNGNLDASFFGIDGAGETLVSHPLTSAERIYKLYQQFPNPTLLTAVQAESRKRPELMNYFPLRKIFHQDADEDIQLTSQLLQHPHPKDFKPLVELILEGFQLEKQDDHFIQRLFRGEGKAPGMKAGLKWLETSKLQQMLASKNSELRLQVIRNLPDREAFQPDKAIRAEDELKEISR